MRKTIYANGEYYHIYNRGVEKRDIFCDPSDYDRFLISMNLLNDLNDGLMIEWRDFKKCNQNASLDEFLKLGFRKRKPLVEIVAYCLNPNHYHFILKQVCDAGVEKYLHKLGTSYTKYFNNKHKRSGVLFQGAYKAIQIDTNEYLLHLSAYVNKNNFIHGYSENNNWEYSSLPEFLGTRDNGLVSYGIITDQFTSRKEYSEFLDENSLYMKANKDMNEYIIEES